MWDESEYAKLPPYDLPTAEQPMAVFLCHQQNGRACAGWCATHDMDECLALRFTPAAGLMDAATFKAIIDYESPVPVFASGSEAAAHGLAQIKRPPVEAIRTIQRLERKLG